MSDPLDAVLNERDNGRGGYGGYCVTFDQKGKLRLPEVPDHDDRIGLCQWLSCVFNLDPKHPISAGERQGPHGPDGEVALSRIDAPEIRFEPATRINTPGKLVEALSWWMLPTDGAVHALNASHCRLISHVVRMLCGLHAARSAKEVAAGIVGDLVLIGEPVTDHTTYGTGGQRYDAAVALRRERSEATGRLIGSPKYLIDSQTGETVVAVSDLQEVARRHVGSSLRHGWLDSKMEALEWERIELQGHGSVTGQHARINAYRGVLAIVDDDQTEAVHT